jgi:hypothetical protein
VAIKPLDIRVPKEGFLERLCPSERSGKMLKVIKKKINTETGEVITEEKEYEAMFNGDGYKVPAHKLGAKLFADIPFPETMTDSEIGKMARLAKLMVSTSNMLGYRAKGGIRPYTQEHIYRIVGLSKKRGKEFIAKMIQLGIVQRNIRKYGDIESVEFYINPAYFFAGRRIGLNLYLLFREHLEQILPKWVRYEFLKAAGEFSRSANWQNISGEE